MKTRKIHMRMCVGCREMKEKRTLLRIVRSPENVISFDRVGKAPGRGAYVCPNADCLKKARKSGRIAKNLECEIPEEVFDTMEKELEENV